MTFVPNQHPVGRAISVPRTILFWLLMIAFAAVLWHMASKGGTEQKSAGAMSYSDFMNNVDQNNIASMRLFLSQSTAEIQGKLRQPAQDFTVTIPKEVIPDLTERLRKQGVSIEVMERKKADPLSLFVTLAPFVVILAVWFYMFKRQRDQQRPPAGTPPSSGPIGD